MKIGLLEVGFVCLFAQFVLDLLERLAKVPTRFGFLGLFDGNQGLWPMSVDFDYPLVASFPVVVDPGFPPFFPKAFRSLPSPVVGIRGRPSRIQLAGVLAPACDWWLPTLRLLAGRC